MDHSKNKSNFPDGDILFNYHPDDSPHKFDYLKGKYVFRFPFTLTSIKWGLSLGLFFGLHTYFKKKNIINSLYWFVFGSLFTGLPIWGFFMVKYSFYSMSLRKFEKEQFQEIEESNLIKNFLKNKVEIKSNIDDEDLLNLINIKQKECYIKSSQFDYLLEDEQMKEIEQRFNMKLGNKD